MCPTRERAQALPPIQAMSCRGSRFGVEWLGPEASPPWRIGIRSMREQITKAIISRYRYAQSGCRASGRGPRSGTADRAGSRARRLAQVDGHSGQLPLKSRARAATMSRNPTVRSRLPCQRPSKVGSDQAPVGPRRMALAAIALSDRSPTTTVRRAPGWAQAADAPAEPATQGRATAASRLPQGSTTVTRSAAPVSSGGRSSTAARTYRTLGRRARAARPERCAQRRGVGVHADEQPLGRLPGQDVGEASVAGAEIDGDPAPEGGQEVRELLIGALEPLAANQVHGAQYRTGNGCRGGSRYPSRGCH